MPAAAIIIIVIIVVPAAGPSHGELSLFIPDIMLAGERYEGMLLLEEPRPGPYPVLLASGGGVAVPEMVLVEAGANHAVFEVVPTEAGAAGTVSAVRPDGDAVQASYQVYPGAGPRIRIIPPSATPGILEASAGEVPLLIYLADHLGAPLRAAGPVPVHLDASPAVRLPGELAIPANRTHLQVTMRVHGDGWVHASSPGLAGDTLEVRTVHDGVSVRLGVAPNPAPPGSAAAWFVWLERDGQAYVPDRTHQVYVTSSHPVAADTRPAAHPGETRPRVMDGGLLHGTIYTGPPASPGDLRGHPGGTTITAAIPGVGSASVHLGVGPQPAGELTGLIGTVNGCLGEGNGTGSVWRGPCGGALQAFGMLGGRVLPGTGSDPATLYLGEADHRTVLDVRAAMRVSGVERPADTVRLWAFPDVPSRMAWLVAGFYWSVPGLPDLLVPARPPEPPVAAILPHVSPLELPRMVPGGGPAVVPIQPPGPANITVSARGIEPASIRVAGQPDGGRHHLGILASPAGDGPGPLGMVWVADDLGRLLEPGAARHTVEVTGYGGVTVEGIRWVGAAGLIHGSWDGSPGGLQARMAGAAPAGAALPPDDDEDPIQGIRLWMPGRVHASEEFPVAVHAVDGEGRPVHRVTSGAAFVSDAAYSVPGDRMVADRPGGGVSAVWAGHADRVMIEPFLNHPGDVRVDGGGERVRLGERITIQVDPGAIPRGTSVRVASGSLDFEPAGANAYAATPGRPGTHLVEVVVGGPGWSAHTRTISYQVDHFVDVSYIARADDGVPIPFGMTLEAASGEGPSHQLIPGTQAVLAPGAYIGRVEENPSLGGQTYRLAGVDINGVPAGAAPTLAVSLREETSVAARYERVILVDAAAAGDTPVDIQGEGAYPFGSRVRLAAPAVPQWLGLVWLVPTSWEGLPEGAHIAGDISAAEFEAVRSADILVHYEKSYVVLVAVMAAGAAAPAVLLRDRIILILSRVLPGMRP